MPILFDKINPDTTLEAIAEFEKIWDVNLPKDYKQFLLKTNGGKGFGNNFIPYLHKYRTKTGDCKEIETFACIDEVFGLSSPNGDLYTVDLHTVNVRVKHGDGHQTSCLPDTVVIAADGGGHNYLGIVISQQRYGQIHFWLDHNPDFEWSLKIADTFTQFLDKIINDPET